jgi:putative ABC transport system permease protein
MRGTLRWVRADLRARRAQALLTTGVVAGVVAALVLATMLLEGTVNPWRGLFARTNGADMLVYLQNGTPAAALSTLPGFEAMGLPYQTTTATLQHGTATAPVALDAMSPVPPVMSRPLVVSGTWLQAASPDGVVVESSFARASHISAGDRITVDGLDGSTSVKLTVIGTAETSDQGFYPAWTPGLLWVLPNALSQVEPSRSETQEVVPLRIKDASALGSAQFVQQVVTWPFNPESEISTPVLRVTTSQQVMQSMASNDRLLGVLLALFGIIALIAAPCAIANVTAARVLTQREDLAMLKALGFTPGQVVTMLLAEQTLLGVAGTGLGLAAALSWPVSWATPLPGSWIALIAAGTVVTVAVATAVPAWRAGLVSPVAAVQASPPRGHLSLLARLGLLVHLPAALVLGARDSLTRRLPAALTVFGVAIPMVMITIALSCWSAIDGFTRDPGRIGLAGSLTVSQGGLSAGAMNVLIARDRDVLAGYPAATFVIPLQAGTTTVLARAVGSTRHPYPFVPVQGSPVTAPGEALAGQGFLDLLHLKVGSWTSVTINGVPVIVHIVGRTLEPADNGVVLDFGLDTLPTARDASSYPPQFYDLVLRPGVSPAAAQQNLLRASGDQLDVQVVSNPADGLGVVLVVIAVSVTVLAVIGLANLLTATMIGLRDHRHEVGVLAALGLTPRQVMATLVVNTTILAGLGVGGGVCAGLALAPRLINMQGRTSGIGAGIATAPTLLTVAALAGAALVLATAAALLLARRTMRLSDPAAQLRSPARPAAKPVIH